MLDTLNLLAFHDVTAQYEARTSWLNWIEQPPPKGQVGGSNPLGVTIFQFNANES